MTTWELIAAKARELPAEKQQEVLDFVDFLRTKEGPRRPLRDPYGLWEDLRVDVTADDLVEARREMWGRFPRDM